MKVREAIKYLSEYDPEDEVYIEDPGRNVLHVLGEVYFWKDKVRLVGGIDDIID